MADRDLNPDLLPGGSVPNTWGNAMSDLWHWRGYYRDGETIDEYDEAGRSRGFAAVDQSRLVAFQLIPQQSGLPTPHVVITDDCRPVFFRRRTHTASLTTGEETQPVETIHVIGWQRTVRGVNVQSLMALYSDGSVALVDDQAVIR